MTRELDRVAEQRMPMLRELGEDLLGVSRGRRLVTLTLPFAAMGGYALFASLRLWPLAVLSVAALCFITYGSTSHDLVHRTLRLPRWLNDFLLALIELLSLRSGTAYRLSHLHHHKHLLATDDVEGSAAHGSLLAAIVAGLSMQCRLWQWAWEKYPRARARLLLEAVGIVLLIVGAAAVYPLSAAPLVYAALVIAGSWIFPFVTVYLPHDAQARTALEKTRLFRGWFFRVIAFDHLYHFEHHLYPAVPHHHWPTLAARLDPFLARCPSGVYRSEKCSRSTTKHTPTVAFNSLAGNGSQMHANENVARASSTRSKSINPVALFPHRRPRKAVVQN